MIKKISERQLSQLNTLKKRCDVTLDFIARKMKNTREDERVVVEMRSIVESAYANKDLVGLKQLSKDINDWTKGASGPDLKELEFELQLLAGVDTKEEEALALDKIHKIVNRSEIENFREYQLLLGRVEAIYADESKSGEVQILNKLLANYDKKRINRRRAK
jgi:hypothetical protein